MAEREAPGGWPAAFLPLARGLLTGVAGVALGGGVVAAARAIAGKGAFSVELSFTGGYVLGIAGWLLGVGVWERWGREWFGLRTKEGPAGWQRYLAFTTDHKVIGVQYLVTFLLLFLLAGLFAMLIRVQLLEPEDPVLSEGIYNRVMSLHGIIMIAVAVAAVIGGFGNYFVPLLIRARDLSFPPLNAL